MRLFFALWPPPPVAERLGALAADCARRYGGRPTRPDTAHLTLSFLGEVADDRLERLIDAARSVDAERFALTVDRLAHWPRHRLLWAGPNAAPPALIELVARLRAALREAGFAGDDPAPDFTAHITLVRKTPSFGEPVLPAQTGAIGWPVARFCLVESRLGREGPAYRRIAEFGLRA